MTLVVTSASRFGISVVADRAVSRRKNDSGVVVNAAQATKCWYRDEANISLAAWGSTRFPDGESYSSWLAEFAARSLISGAQVGAVASSLADELAQKLERFRPATPWFELRRGIHVAGYQDEMPCIYHVHMGTPELSTRPKSHCDFPELHGGGELSYREALARGLRAQVRNGYHELFSSVAEMFGSLKADLESEFQILIPAPTLKGQLELDKTLVRLSAGLLASAGIAEAVSVDVDCFAFTGSGRARIDTVGTPSPTIGVRPDLTNTPTQSAG